MKHTIRFRYMMILAGTVAAVAVTAWVVISLFLEPFYMSRKENTLIRAHKQLEARLERDGGVTESTKLYLWGIKETSNVEIFLYDSSQETVYSQSSEDSPRGVNTLLD